MHTHNYKIGKSKTVKTCFCGSFKWLRTDGAIVGIPAPLTLRAYQAKKNQAKHDKFINIY